MLREMYEQFVFGKAEEVERVIRGTSPYLKFAFKSPSCIMIAEFSEISDISIEAIDRKLRLGETELLSLTFIPRCQPELTKKFKVALTTLKFKTSGLHM